MYYACAVVRDDAATAVGSSGCGRKAVALFGGIPLFALLAAVAGYVVQLQPVHAATLIENLLAPPPPLKAA
jgi:hypothetical protein